MSDHLALVRHLPHHHGEESEKRVMLRADRVTLAKRRWRGVAEDGREFGFDLEAPLTHGVCFFIEGKTHYLIDQPPEEVLEIPVVTPEEAAHVAWHIGNLHLGAQVLPAILRVADDPAAVQMLAREGIAFQRHTSVFMPIATGGHHHHHAHD